MMFSHYSHSRNGHAVLDYFLKEPAHSPGKQRNARITSIGFLPDTAVSYYKQWDWYRARASQRNKTEVQQLIVSYSKESLPPEDPQSYDTAISIARELANEAYPGFSFLIFVQNDGQSGHVHTHMISPNVSIEGKGFSRLQTKHYYLMKHVDAISAKYINIEMGKKAPDKVTKSERGRRQRNKELEKENELIEAKNLEIEKLNKTRPSDQQLPLFELKPLYYIWKDDLKSRIRESMKQATSREQFLTELTRHGVEGEYRNTRGNGEFIVYELTDLSNFRGDYPSKKEYFKAKSYKLGSDYDIEELDSQILKNLEHRKEVAHIIHSDDHREVKEGPAGFRYHRAEAVRRAKEAGTGKQEITANDKSRSEDYTSSLQQQEMIRALQQDIEQLDSSISDKYQYIKEDSL